jgi:uncharacterized DUF497 family protein
VVDVAQRIEFDWDKANTKHLAMHKVTIAEFEQVFEHDPLDLDYELVDEEERYRAVGPTSQGRLLSVVFTIRDGRIRGVTAFPASSADRQAFMRRFP